MKDLVGAFRLMLALLVAAPLMATATTTNFFEGFESGLSGWSVGDGNFNSPVAYWGVVDTAFGGEGTHSGDAKGYCAAIGYAGNATDPTYQNDMFAYLSRTVDLTGFTNASLSFWFKFPGIETGFDSARVRVGNVEVWFGDAVDTNWTLVTLSLEPFIGFTQILAFEFTSDASVTREGWYLDDITLTDAATPGSPPANDAFAAAQMLSGSIGSAGAVNRNATSEPNEPDPGNSIWFRWTPYTNGPVTFRTDGSAFPTLLCVYAGDTVTNLTNLVRLACNANGGTNDASLVSFNAGLGTNYFISVRGVSNASGFVLLSWEQLNGLGNDLLPDLFVWANAANDYLYGWHIDQYEPTQPGRTLLRVSTATPNMGSGPLELRGSSASPGVYQRVFRRDGSFYDRFAGNFTFHPGHGHLHFDNWMNLHLRRVLTNDGVGDIIGSGDKTSFAIIDIFPYNSALPGAPGSAQYGGGLVQGLSVGWGDVYSSTLPDQWIDVTEVPSGRYWLEAIVDPANSVLESDESNNVSRILIDYVQPGEGPPPNDSFEDAIAIPAISGSDLGHNFNGSHQIGEPDPLPGVYSPRTVWWRWTAPVDMTATITTDGSQFDTVLAVYVGTNVSNLLVVAFDDDDGLGRNSLLSFNAVAGTTYQIQVAGYEDTYGSIQLNVNPALNDFFTNRLVLTGATGEVNACTRGATREAGEPLHDGVLGAGSIWFSWNAPENGPFTFDTSGSSFDTLLGIYSGSTVDALTVVASDNNSGSNGASLVTFNAISNATYRLAVDGVAATGFVRLAWSGPAAPGIVTQPLSTNAPAGAAVQFQVVARGSAPLSFQWRHQSTNLGDNEYISGSGAAVLLLNKVRTNDAGIYTVVITNAWGAVTSAPANLIVLDNARVVFVEETSGHSGGFVRVPIELQSVGNEHAVSFTLVFDPSVLSRPRATNVPSGATLLLNTNQLGGGALGVVLALPGLGTFPTGIVSVVDFIFDAAASVTTVNSFAGLGNAPTARAVLSTNGMNLPALFVAGTIDLEPLRLVAASWSNGTFQLTFPTVAGERYVVETSTNLTNWSPFVTNSAAGITSQFTDTNAGPQRFYRARLLP